MAVPLPKSWSAVETDGASIRFLTAPVPEPVGPTIEDLQQMLFTAFPATARAERTWSFGRTLALGLACGLVLWSIAAFAIASLV